MKLLVASATLSFLMGVPTFAYPQQDQQQQEEKTQKQQEEKRKQAPDQRGEKRQEEPTKQQEDRARQEKQQQQISKQQEKQQKETEKRQRKMQDEQTRQEEPRTRGGQERAQRSERGETHRGGRRIPDDRFHAEFGREHRFHGGIRRGDPRFVYGGYRFEYVDAWPVEWSDDDDFYIDFIDDGYYLCDFEHPEVRLVVIVVD